LRCLTNSSSNSLLPLYSGPQVTIRIGSTGCEYRLSKALLCKQSPYFKATFQGSFQEGKEQSTTLNEVDGVVSQQSFELLVQWLYLGRVLLGNLTPKHAIAAVIEFVRIADMCGVTGMESIMAEQIKAIILANPAPSGSNLDSNTYCIDSSHIISAASLPDGHTVRKVLAAAVAGAFFEDGNHKFKKEVKEVANFASDLLEAVRDILKSYRAQRPSACVTDPLSGKPRSLPR
jgi:BTB/POZ domain